MKPAITTEQMLDKRHLLRNLGNLHSDMRACSKLLAKHYYASESVQMKGTAQMLQTWIDGITEMPNGEGEV